MADSTSATASAEASAPSKPRSGKMLFVSRLPYSISTDLLNDYFGDIGPLRKAFVVTDKETKQSKGVAYVQYALADDAERAIETLGNKPIPGTDGPPRPIRIELARSIRDPTGPPRGKRAAEQEAEGANKKLKSEPSESKMRPVKKETKKEETNVVPPLGPGPATPTSSTPTATHPSAPPAPTGEARALAQRTLILSGLDRCSPLPDTKQLYKRVRKLGDVDEVMYPAPGESVNVAHIIFRTPNHAHLAVSKLDGHVFKSATLRAWLKARVDARQRLDKMITNPETRARRQETAQKVAEHSILQSIVRLSLPHSSIRVPGQPPVDGMELLSHASGGALANGRIERRNRLIVRNLPFDITTEDLKAYFLPFGPLYDVDVPQVEKKARVHKQPRRGETDECAIEVKEESEGETEVKQEEESSGNDDDGDESQSDSGLDSQSDSASAMQDEPTTQASSSKPVKVKVESESEDEGMLPVEVSTSVETKPEEKPEDTPETKLFATPTRGRGFGFVWFVSYGDAERAIESMNGQTLQRGQAERMALQAAKNSGLGVVRRKAKKTLDAVLQHVHEPRQVTVTFALAKDEWEKVQQKVPETADSEEHEENDIGSGDEANMSHPPPPDEGTTLFVRNVPFSASEKEFAALFRHFGPMRYARLVMGSDKQPRGTGFVCFWDRDHADAALALAKRVAAEAAADTATTNKDKDKHYSSVLTADAGSALAAPLTLQGRVLTVIPAMERSDAAAVAADRVAARAKTDKRNTYLLREGVPFAHSELASVVGEKDAEIRCNSFGLRKQQLASNAALYVSPTRLSVRRLPLWVGDVELRKLAAHALKAFDDEVLAGSRPDLAPAEKTAAGFDPGSVSSTKGRVHARVIRQKERLDQLFGSRGLGRSQGYGFVELRSLPDALKVLRWLNANKASLPVLARLHRAELEGAQKHLKAELKHTVDPTDEARDKRADAEALYKRLEVRLNEIGSDPDSLARSERGGSLLVEFSLENATITRKRKERAMHLKAGNARKAQEEGTSNANDLPLPPGRWPGRAGNDSTRDRRSGSASKRALYERKANLKIDADKKSRRGPGAGAATITKSAAAIISRKRKEKKTKRSKA